MMISQDGEVAMPLRLTWLSCSDELFGIQFSVCYSLPVMMMTGDLRPQAERKCSHCSGLATNADASFLPFI